MSEPPKSGVLPLVLGALIGVPVVLMLFTCMGSRARSARPPRPVFDSKSAEPASAPAAAPSAAPAPAPPPSERRDEEGFSVLAPGQEPPESREGARRESRPAPAAPARAPEPALPAAESAALESALGGWDEKKAYAAGGRLFKLGETLLRYPKVVKHVLDNELVIKGFMALPQVQRRCHDPAAVIQYMSDARAPNGISVALETFRRSLDIPGAANAIFGSRLVGTVLRSCGSIQTVIRDREAVKAIVTANPAVLPIMSDPRFTSALGANPAAFSAFQSVQGALLPARP